MTPAPRLSLWLAFSAAAFGQTASTPVVLTSASVGPTTPTATISFHFERAGVPVPVYTFTVREDGSGTYLAPPPTPPATTRSPYALPPAEAPPDKPILHLLALSPKTAAMLFSEVRATGGLRDGLCQSRAKNVADTGRKVLGFTAPDGAETHCTFNYSDSKPVAAILATFQAMAVALDSAERLTFLHRFDRLGLDAEMNSLIAAFKDGRAAEPGNIAAVLRALVEDPEVLERVRTQAAKLLGMAEASTPAPAERP